MNLDFHVHGILSKKHEFDPILLLQGIEYGIENGLDGFIMCEHFNAFDFMCLHHYLKNNFQYKDDRYMVNGFSIFTGLEVGIKDKGHVILSGHRDNIIELRTLLEPYFHKDNLVDFQTLLDLADDYNCIKIGAHPFRRGHKLYKQPIDLLRRLDALDFNAKDIYEKGVQLTLEELNTLSYSIGVNVVTGSDTHYPIQLGCVKTTLNKECSTVSEIRECIKAQDYSITINNSLDLMVKSSKFCKKHLTSINQDK